jgi:hypothetical protein
VLAATVATAGPGGYVAVEADTPVAGGRNVTLTFAAEAASTRAGIASLRVRLPEGITGSDVSWVSGPVGWQLARTSNGYQVVGPALPVGKDATYAIKVATLPNTSLVHFPTIETFSDGHEDAWVEIGVDPSIEPEMPAQALTLTGAPASARSDMSALASTNPAAQSSSKDSHTAVYIGVGVAALLVLLAAGNLLVWRRARTQ